MANEDKNQSIAPKREQDVLKTAQPVNKDRKVVRNQQISLVQRQEDGTTRLSFEADDHGARPGMMVLEGEQAKSIPEGDDRGYLTVYDDGSQEWKSTADVEAARKV